MDPSLWDDCGNIAAATVEVLDAAEWAMVASRTLDGASIALLRCDETGPSWALPWAVVVDDGGAGPEPEAWMWAAAWDAKGHLEHLATWGAHEVGVIARELLDAQVIELGDRVGRGTQGGGAMTKLAFLDTETLLGAVGVHVPGDRH